MSLTPQGATLIIYLTTNVFLVYTIYCAMKLFFDKPPAGHWQAWASYGLYFIGITMAYLLVNRLSITIMVNIIFILIISINYQGSWQRRVASVVFTYVLIYLCEMATVVIVDAAGAAHFTRFDDQAFIISLLIARTLNFLIIMLLGKLNLIHGHEQISQISWATVIAVPLCTALPVLTLVMIGNERELPIIMFCIIALFASICWCFTSTIKLPSFIRKN